MNAWSLNSGKIVQNWKPVVFPGTTLSTPEIILTISSSLRCPRSDNSDLRRVDFWSLPNGHKERVLSYSRHANGHWWIWSGSPKHSGFTSRKCRISRENTPLGRPWTRCDLTFKLDDVELSPCWFRAAPKLRITVLTLGFSLRFLLFVQLRNLGFLSPYPRHPLFTNQALDQLMYSYILYSWCGHMICPYTAYHTTSLHWLRL